MMKRRHFVSLLVPAVALAATALGQVSPTVKGSREDLRGARTVFREYRKVNGGE